MTLRQIVVCLLGRNYHQHPYYNTITIQSQVSVFCFWQAFLAPLHVGGFYFWQAFLAFLHVGLTYQWTGFNLSVGADGFISFGPSCEAFPRMLGFIAFYGMGFGCCLFCYCSLFSLQCSLFSILENIMVVVLLLFENVPNVLCQKEIFEH